MKTGTLGYSESPRGRTLLGQAGGRFVCAAVLQPFLVASIVSAQDLVNGSGTKVPDPAASPEVPYTSPEITDPAAIPSPSIPLSDDDDPPGALKFHEVLGTGDFFYAQGSVTLPVSFSLAQVPGLGGFGITPSVATPSRKTDFVGASASYGYKKWLYFDLAYRLGSSSGAADLPLGPNNSALPSNFSISENWYQAFATYVPSRWRNSDRQWAYIRGGVSYVTAELGADTVGQALGLYRQSNDTRDVLGNLGFGFIRYFDMENLGFKQSTKNFYLGLRGDVEGFYGFRDQKSTEELPAVAPFPFVETDINNTLFGGFGRGTVRLEYRFRSLNKKPNEEKTELFRIVFDAGMQVNYTVINYPQQPGFSGGDFNEILWGPFFKLGFSYKF